MTKMIRNKFSSKNAYMLVYTRRDRRVPEIDFPASVAARLADESSSFESSVSPHPHQKKKKKSDQKE